MGYVYRPEEAATGLVEDMTWSLRARRNPEPSVEEGVSTVSAVPYIPLPFSRKKMESTSRLQKSTVRSTDFLAGQSSAHWVVYSTNQMKAQGRFLHA